MQNLQSLMNVGKPGNYNCILLMGATAVGKTSLSIKLSNFVDCEIVSLDSVQVYKEADICSDKVSIEDRRIVNHHMIDVSEVSDVFSAYDYFVGCCQCCNEILKKGKIPILVGGSCFYAEALFNNYCNLVKPNFKVRESIDVIMQNFGVSFAYQCLFEKDSKYALKITKNDRQKIQRALEVIEIKGSKISREPLKLDARPFLNVLPIWITNSFDVIKNLISERCKQMIKNGLLEETSKLCKKGLLSNYSLRNAIGYRQSIEFLENKISETNLFEKMIKASCLLAKRQIKWGRSKKYFINLHSSDENIISKIVNSLGA